MCYCYYYIIAMQYSSTYSVCRLLMNEWIYNSNRNKNREGEREREGEKVLKRFKNLLSQT